MEKINLVEILKDCPKGMELDCTMYNEVSLLSVDDREDINFPIRVAREDGNYIALTKYGQYIDVDFAKCVIFPKGKTTWEGFQRPFKNGDIVTWKDRGALVACIYKERKNTSSFYHHIALYKGGVGIIVNSEIALMDNQLRLATEEEKKKLFDAIKANGYKWNAETKTLEKLPKFKVGDKITDKNKFIYRITEITDKGYKLHDLKTTFITFEEADCYFVKVMDIFDINTLIPFESRVLVRDHDYEEWRGSFWGHLRQGADIKHDTIRGVYIQCIPYENNEHLLGTTDDCNDYYKTW